MFSFSFTFTKMHKLKQVHDTFKVLTVFFSLQPWHSLQYLTNLTFKILHSYHNQCTRKTILNHSIFKTKKAFQINAQAALDKSAIDQSADLCLVLVLNL